MYGKPRYNALYAFDREGYVVWYIARNELLPEHQRNFRFYDAIPLKDSFNWLVQGYSKLLEITPLGEVVSVRPVALPADADGFISRFHHDITTLGDENYAVAMSFGRYYADRAVCPREKLPGAELVPHTVSTYYMWDRVGNELSYLANDTEIEGLDLYRDRTLRSCTMYRAAQMSHLS